MHDAIIIGGGFAGLSAAVALRAAGLDCLLLEARDRVGGRVEAQQNGLGERIDTGGQFLCDDMPELMALARCHGKALVEAPVYGAAVTQPPIADGMAEHVYVRTMALRDRMKLVSSGDPAIRDVSVGAWLAVQDESSDVKSAFRSMIEGLWCQSLDVIPLWHLIESDRRITNTQSELQYFLAETMQSLAEAIAETLGDSVRLGTPVERIERGSGIVRVITSRATFEARRIVVAVPPVMASGIHYDPPLPPRLADALGAWRSGTVIKAIVRYRRAFWREGGLSGMVMWRDLHGLFACDVSKSADEPALVVFIGGPLAVQWQARGDFGLRGEIVLRLTEALGPMAAQPLDVVIRNWTDDKWSGGGYSDLILDMSATDAESVIVEGVGPLQFACSELSPSYPGYIEGAIIAGRIAARRLIDELASNSG